MSILAGTYLNLAQEALCDAAKHSGAKEGSAYAIRLPRPPCYAMIALVSPPQVLKIGRRGSDQYARTGAATARNG